MGNNLQGEEATRDVLDQAGTHTGQSMTTNLERVENTIGDGARKALQMLSSITAGIMSEDRETHKRESFGDQEQQLQFGKSQLLGSRILVFYDEDR